MLLQSDSTRAQDYELKIQARVHSELRKIRESQAERLDSLTASLTTNPPKPEESSSSSSEGDSSGLFAHLKSPFYHDWSSKEQESKTANTDSGRSHDSVHGEIMDLRKKLDSRKKVEKVPEELEKAKESLVSCLRTNDRRPLDCWEEVQAFKVEVGKLEKAFIQKASG
jgi:altered-inheritance-of-mitochondria protein 13